MIIVASIILLAEFSSRKMNPLHGTNLVIVMQRSRMTNSACDICLPSMQQILNCFTCKAARTVLNQLYEMNPPKYMWFYEWVFSSSPCFGGSILCFQDLRDLRPEWALFRVERSLSMHLQSLTTSFPMLPQVCRIKWPRRWKALH